MVNNNENFPIKLGGKDHETLFTTTLSKIKENQGRKKLSKLNRVGDVLETKVNRLMHALSEFYKSARKRERKWEWVNNKNQLKMLNQTITALTPNIEDLTHKNHDEIENNLPQYVQLLNQVDEVVKLLESSNANKNKTNEIKQSLNTLAKKILEIGEKENLQNLTETLAPSLQSSTALSRHNRSKSSTNEPNPKQDVVSSQEVLPEKSYSLSIILSKIMSQVRENKQIILPNLLNSALQKAPVELRISDSLLQDLIRNNFGEEALTEAQKNFSDQLFIFKQELEGIKVTCPTSEQESEPSIFYLNSTQPASQSNEINFLDSPKSQVLDTFSPLTLEDREGISQQPLISDSNVQENNSTEQNISFSISTSSNLESTADITIQDNSLPPAKTVSTPENMLSSSSSGEKTDLAKKITISSDHRRRIGLFGFLTFLITGVAVGIKGSTIIDSTIKTAEIADVTLNQAQYIGPSPEVVPAEELLGSMPQTDTTKESIGLAASGITATLAIGGAYLSKKKKDESENELENNPPSAALQNSSSDSPLPTVQAEDSNLPSQAREIPDLYHSSSTAEITKAPEISNLSPPSPTLQTTAQNPPPQTLNKEASEAEILFALVNLGSAEVLLLRKHKHDFGILTLEFTILILEEMLKDGSIPPNETETTRKLLNNFKSGLDIAQQNSTLRQIPDMTGEQFIDEKLRIKEFIISKLQTDKEIFIPAGYEHSIAGHEVGLKLKVVEVEGVTCIQGEIINRGEGLEYHGKSIQHQLKEQYASILSLSSVPLEGLKDSEFLNCLTELNISKAVFRKNPSLGNEFSENIDYTIADFYEIALNEWPGEIIQSGIPQIARGCQRGSTCTIKTYLTVIRNTCPAATANHIKLRMRIRSIELLLKNAPLEEYRISHLEWPLAKLNRSLEKLIKQGIATENEKEICLSLSKQVEEKIAAIREKTKLTREDPERLNLNLTENENYEITIPPVPKLNEKPDLSIPRLKFSKTEVFSHIEESVNMIKKIGEYDRFHFWPKRNNEQYTNEATVSRLSLEFLESLPEASDPLWLTLKSKDLYHLSEICSLLVETSTTRRGLKNYDDHHASAYTTLGSKQITAIVNAYAGILLRSKKQMSEELLGQQAATILKLLDNVCSQIRVKTPKDLETFEKAKEILKGLNPKGIQPSNTFLSDQKFEYRTLENIQNDPLARHIYDSLIEKKGKLKGFLNSETNTIEQTISVMGDMCLFHYNGAGKKMDNKKIHNLKDPYLDMTLFHLTNPLIIGLAGRFNFNQFPYFGYSTNVGYYDYNGIPTLKKEVLHNETYGDDTVGLLIHTYFPWTQKETKLVSLLLDSRSPNRENENRQMLLSKDGDFSLGDEKIPREEMEKLLSITTYEETLVPQCIRYFEQHPSRLKDPGFVALLEAFLWTNASNGKPILQNVMMEKDNTVADQFITFLENSLKNSHNLQFFETELALTRILAQVCQFAKEAPPDRYQKMKTLLFESMKKAQESLSLDTIQLETKSQIQHWLVALYPYVENDPYLIKICQNANDQLNLSGLNYLFHHRWTVQEDFETGWVALSTKITTPPNRLPWFVTKSSNYLFPNVNPDVKKLNENTYQFSINKVLTRIIVSGKEFQTYQLRKREDGTDAWFVYTSTSSFPQVNPETLHHPCGYASDSPGYFLKGTRLWTSLVEPFESLLTSQKDNQIICHITKNKIINAKEPNLELANVYESENPIFKSFLSLDDKLNILCWQTRKKEVTTFDFPNYDLRIELKNGKWESSKHPGFYVDTKAVVMELEPYEDYIVLKNDEGKKIVLISNREIEHAPTEFGQNSHLFKSSKTPSLYEFTLNKAGKLQVPEDHTKLLYLIHRSLRSLDYTKARILIHKLSLHPADWTNKEQEIYSWMEIPEDLAKSPKIKEKYTDQHPYAAALRCKMRLIALKSEASKVKISELKTDYLNCLSQFNSLGPEWLSEEDEHEIFKVLEGLDLSPILEARKNELNHSPTTLKIIPSTLNLKDKKIHFPVTLTEEIQSQIANQAQLIPIALKLRPGADFVLNFYLYYQIAFNKEPKEDFENLKTLLRLSKNAPEESHKYLHTILSDMVSDHPSDHPNVKWPDPSTMKRRLEYGLLESEVSYCLNRAKIEDLTLLIPSETSFQAKLKLSPEFEKNLIPNKGVRITHPAKDQEVTALAPFTVNFEENTELTRLIKSLDRQNPEKEIKDLESDIEELNKLRDVVFPLPQNADPCVITSYEKTREGINEKISHLQNKISILKDPQTISYCLSTTLEKTEEVIKKVDDLSNEIARKIRVSSDNLQTKEAKILKILHGYPDDLQRLVYGGIIRPIEIQELIVWFGVQNDDRILQSNPSLKGKLSELKSMVAEYLVDLTEHNQLTKAEEVLNDLKTVADKDGWESTAVKNLSDKFVATLTAKRAYQPQDPKLSTLLVFEAFSGLRLRQDQIAALEKLTSGTELINFEIEARTGFGKSQVLIPLWLFLTSRKDRMTMMTVPTALLSDQSLHLQKMLGNAFSIGIQKIKFDRNRSKDVKHLRKINEKLEKAKKNKRVLLIDIKSLHGLCGLALKQALIEEDDPEVTQELLDLRIKIQTNLSNFIDESRDCLAVRQRYDYSIGDPVPVTQQQCNEVGNFFEKLIFHDAILNKWNFEFLPDFYDPKKLTLTELNIDLLKSDLVDSILAKYKINEDLRSSLEKHLLGGASDESTKKYLSSLSDDERRHYAWLKEQLTSTLSRTCLRVCGTDYDLLNKEEGNEIQDFEHEEGFTVPCLRGTPKPTSEFTNLDDRMISTVQANLKRNFSLKRMERFINSLKELENISEGNLVGNPKFELLRKIQEQMGMSTKLIDITNEDIERMTHFLNGKDAKNLRLEFITHVILPQIKYYKHKISGTSFNLIRSQPHVQAASGTVDPDTLPPRMKPIASLSAPIGNLLAVYKNSTLKVLKSNKPQEILDNLLEKDLKHRVIVDGAGYFRDLSRSKVVETIMTKTSSWDPPVKGVTYFDEDGRCMILERGKTVPVLRENSLLSTDETYIYIRQSKAVGSDIAMSTNAKAFVTFGKDTNESFIWQAWGRMRGLETGQSLDIVTTEGDASVISSTLAIDQKDLSVSHTFQYAKKIEANGKDYFFSLRLYLEDRIEELLWRHLQDPKRFEEVFSKLKPLLVDNTEKDPLKSLFSTYKPIGANDAVKQLLNSVIGPLKALGHQEFEKDIKTIETDFEKHVDFKKLPLKISMSDCVAESAELEVEDEATEETEEEQELEQEQEQEQTIDFGSFTFQPTPPIDWDGDYTSLFKETSEKTVLGIPLYFSPNLNIIEMGKDLSSKIRKKTFQLILKVDDKGVQLCPMDLHDSKAALIRMTKAKKQKSEKGEYYIISGKHLIASTKEGSPDLSKTLKEDWIKISIIAKIFSSDKTFTSSQIAWLKKHPQELEEALALSANYLKVWPHLLTLTQQLEKIRKEIGLEPTHDSLGFEIKR